VAPVFELDAVLSSREEDSSRQGKGRDMVEYKNILFCTDFSVDANIAFLHALNLAKKYGAKLHIMHVPHSPYTYNRQIVDDHLPEGKSQDGQAFFGDHVVDEVVKALREAYAKRIGDFANFEFIVRCGSPDVEIVRYARSNEIDLIVMGTLGKHESERLERGSTVASVSKYAHCHVMAIRNPAKQFTLPGKMN
jgi:nucleotide-binding universal stress UspA family protein